MKFASVIAIALAATLGACASTPREATRESISKPNIVFILADDLGYGDVGCYGQKQIQTPHIDQLAAEGLRFTNAYAGSPVCAPSRCSFLTGLHSGHAFVRGNAKVDLRPADVTVAEVLHDAGYATYAAGKWGLGAAGSAGTPTRQGFDGFYGFIDQTHAHNSWPAYLYENDARLNLRNVVPNPGQYGQGVATVQMDFANDLFDEKITGFLESVPAGKPFFVYAAFTAPHANNEARAIEVPDLGPYASRDWPESQKRYAALTTRLDTYVGNITRTLKLRGLDRNTLVIFTSDNGTHEEGGNAAAFFNSSGEFRGIKRAVYEGGIRVPFIARWPAAIRPGTTDQPIAFWDFLPTAAELAGTRADQLPTTDGLSFAPTLLSQPARQKQHDFFYWEFHEGGFRQAVRMGDPVNGDWKAVRLGLTGTLELYNLRADPGEKTNLAAQHPHIIAKITAYLATARTDSSEFPVRP